MLTKYYSTTHWQFYYNIMYISQKRGASDKIFQKSKLGRHKFQEFTNIDKKGVENAKINLKTEGGS